MADAGTTIVVATTFANTDLGFWIQTGALFVSAIAALVLIWHNGQVARRRALIDLMIQQKSDAALIADTQQVYSLHECGNHLSSLVGDDSPQRRTILHVLNNQEFIAVGIRLGAFDEKVYKQMQCSNVIKLWSATSGFIHEIRKIDRKNTIFQDFEKLSKRWEANPIKRVKP